MKLKFLTLNIWKGNLLDKVISFLRQESPDVCALQEVYSGTDPALPKKYRSFSQIKTACRFPYAVLAPAFLDATSRDFVENGNAIFSRFPILVQESTFYDIPYGVYEDKPSNYERCPRNLQHASIALRSKTIEVFNTHGIYGIDGKDNARRLSMSRTIINAVKGHPLTILSGDFNLPPGTRTIRSIGRHLPSVFGNTLTTTFNMKRKTNPEYGKVAVDMIFVGKGMRVVRKRCPRADVSDHLPLVVSVEV